MSVNVFPSPSPELILTRPHKENDADEKVALLLQWALPSLLSRVSVDRLLQILSLLLVEMKFIVVSDEIPLLSAATLGLASLLHPLGWAGPLISVLPPSMHEYMEVRLLHFPLSFGSFIITSTDLDCVFLRPLSP